jgi:hypothetical protein
MLISKDSSVQLSSVEQGWESESAKEVEEQEKGQKEAQMETERSRTCSKSARKA